MVMDDKRDNDVNDLVELRESHDVMPRKFCVWSSYKLMRVCENQATSMEMHDMTYIMHEYIILYWWQRIAIEFNAYLSFVIYGQKLFSVFIICFWSE